MTHSEHPPQEDLGTTENNLQYFYGHCRTANAGVTGLRTYYGTNSINTHNSAALGWTLHQILLARSISSS